MAESDLLEVQVILGLWNGGHNFATAFEVDAGM